MREFCGTPLCIVLHGLQRASCGRWLINNVLRVTKLHGVQGVGGLNPLTPTSISNHLRGVTKPVKAGFFICGTVSGTPHRRPASVPANGRWCYKREMIREDAINVFTDGSSFSGPRVGGIGIRVVTVDESGNEVVEDHAQPGYRGATNNEMELQACIEGLKLAVSHSLGEFRIARRRLALDGDGMRVQLGRRSDGFHAAPCTARGADLFDAGQGCTGATA